MRTQKFIKIFILFIVLLIVSCGPDYKVRTIIYADGSCQRTLIVSYRDSIVDFFEEDYPIPIDTTWSLAVEIDTTDDGDTVYVHTASKFFASIEQLNQQYAKDTGIFKIVERSVTLEKRFRWFYTFLDYKETYPKLFDQPTLISYLDSTHYNYAMLPDDEQEKYLKENFDSTEARLFGKEVNRGLEKWLEITIVNSCLDAVEESVDSIKEWPLSKSEFSVKRDSIDSLMDSVLDLFDEDDDLWEMLDRIFDIDSLLVQRLEKEDEFKKFMDKQSLWEDIILSEEYINIVAMPGLIIETNSTKISEDNEVEWTVEWMKYFTDDYEMHVQSRIVNKWAFWVSGGFILLVLITLFLRIFAKSKKE